MEKLELHQRMTHTYADGWSDLDEWQHLGTAKMLRWNATAEPLGFDDAGTYTTKVIGPRELRAVDPAANLAPYNKTLAQMSKHQRAVWAAMTDQQLQQHKGRTITVLAGKHYAAAVEGWPNVSRPLTGQGIGQQLHTLKHLNA